MNKNQFKVLGANPQLVSLVDKRKHVSVHSLVVEGSGIHEYSLALKFISRTPKDLVVSAFSETGPPANFEVLECCRGCAQGAKRFAGDGSASYVARTIKLSRLASMPQITLLSSLHPPIPSSGPFGLVLGLWSVALLRPLPP